MLLLVFAILVPRTRGLADGRKLKRQEMEVVLGAEQADKLSGKVDLAPTFGSQGRWKGAKGGLQVIKRVLGAEHSGTPRLERCA